MADNAAAKQRRRGPGRPFRPGQSGNPAGKPKGTRHRATMLEAVGDHDRNTLRLRLDHDGLDQPLRVTQ